MNKNKIEMEIVSEKEFNKRIKEETIIANNKLVKLGLTSPVDTRWLVDTGSNPPCCYGSCSSYDTIECHITEKPYKKRPLPKKFKFKLKSNVCRIIHVTDKICIHLSMNTTARCYAVIVNTNNKLEYQICTHLVGNCPHKKSKL